MKKHVICLLAFLYLNGISFAVDNNEIYLETDDNISPQTEIRGIVNMDSTEIKYENDFRKNEHDTLLYKDVDRLRPEKKSFSKNIEKEVLKNVSIGAGYSATEKSGNLDDSVSIYSKYQKKHFGLTTSYSQNRDNYKENGISGGSISIAPELSLNKKIKLRNVYSNNLTSNQQKGEMVLSISPFKDDRMDFNIGAGETFSNGANPSQSQINIGTRFRF